MTIVLFPNIVILALFNRGTDRVFPAYRFQPREDVAACLHLRMNTENHVMGQVLDGYILIVGVVQHGAMLEAG